MATKTELEKQVKELKAQIRELKSENKKLADYTNQDTDKELAQGDEISLAYYYNNGKHFLKVIKYDVESGKGIVVDTIKAPSKARVVHKIEMYYRFLGTGLNPERAFKL